MTLLESLKLSMGSNIIDFSLPATDGNTYSLSNFSDNKVLVIIFMCNHCPYVKAIINRLIKLQSDYSEKGVQIIGINANESKNYPEDSFDSMKKIVEEAGINFIYLHDESQEIAKAYQAQCTPDIYVFNQNRKLIYHGRLDDNWKESNNVQKQDLREALDATLSGQPITDVQHPSMGCSIKWK